jgi:tetratricopeptide (TPR) repeat protein
MNRPRSRVIATALLVLAAAPGFPATAQTVDGNATKCAGATGSPDDIIAGCTAYLDSGQASLIDLFSLYANRANAYRATGDYAHAIEDYDKAIKLDPKNADRYNNRAIS